MEALQKREENSGWAARSIPSLAPQQTPLCLPPGPSFPRELASVTAYPYLLPRAAVTMACSCHPRTARRSSWCGRTNVHRAPLPSSMPALQGASSNAERCRARDAPGVPLLVSSPTPLNLWQTVDHHSAKERRHLYASVYVKGICGGQSKAESGALWCSCGQQSLS